MDTRTVEKGIPCKKVPHLSVLRFPLCLAGVPGFDGKLPANCPLTPSPNFETEVQLSPKHLNRQWLKMAEFVGLVGRPRRETRISLRFRSLDPSSQPKQIAGMNAIWQAQLSAQSPSIYRYEA